MDTRQGINSVEIAFSVVEAVEHAGRPVTLTELANALNTQPSKLFRYLVSLTRVGLLSRDGDGAYDFGPSMRRLGAEASRRTNEIAAASLHTPKLRDRTGHSVNISVWGDRGPTICRWDFGEHALPIIPRTGSVLPLLSTSAGQMFLALLPRAMTSQIVDAELRGSSDLEAALNDVESLRETIHERGYAAILGAVVPGLTTFSAGTHNTERQLPVVLTVVCAAGTLPSDDDREQVVSELLSTTSLIARELGI